MSIYTRTGDGGMASTLDRSLIPKDSPVFEALGGLDELGAALGVALGSAPAGIARIIQALQKDLMGFSGELAGGMPFANGERIRGLEQSIDAIMESAGGFQGFVAAGGTPCGAALDLARTVARRAERGLVKASAGGGGISGEAMAWLNRLSDLLYALARLADSAGEPAQPAPPQGDCFLESMLWLCKAVVERARTLDLRVVAAACDGGGNLVSLLRDDGAYLASVDIAGGKAYTAVALRTETARLALLCAPGGPLYGVQHADPRLVIIGGGIPLYRGGALAGGLGVSGGAAEQDVMLAQFAKEQWERRELDEQRQ